MVWFGDDFVVCLLWCKIVVEFLLNEQCWLFVLVFCLLFFVLVLQCIGYLIEIYFFFWSVFDWLFGMIVDCELLGNDQVEVFVDFFFVVYQFVFEDVFVNWYCGFLLVSKVEDYQGWLKKFVEKGELILLFWQELWQCVFDMEIDVGKMWIVGDMYVCNVFVSDGRISVFIDWGDLCEGDCVMDFVLIWVFFLD